MNTTGKVGVGFIVLAFLLVLVATFSPGWIQLGSAAGGLFYACLPGFGCNVYSAASVFPVPYIITFALMILAVVLMLPGFFLAIIGCRGDGSKLKTAGGLFIAGGIFTLIAVGVFTGLTLPAHALLASAIVQIYFYGYWMAWIGGVFAIIGGALTVHSSKTTEA